LRTQLGGLLGQIDINGFGGIFRFAIHTDRKTLAIGGNA
jgi:hypothetical protein